MQLFIMILGHVANLIYLVGYLVKNMVWLRILVMIGAFGEIFYSYFISSEPLWINIFWCTVYIIANAYQIFVLITESMNLKFTEDEEKIFQMTFSNLSKIDFSKLAKIAKWKVAESGKVIVDEGVTINRLIVIYSGIAEVKMNHELIAYLRDGNFIGEMSFITGSVTTAQVIALTEIKYIYWDKATLNSFLQKNEQIEQGLKTSFNIDLVKKLIKK